MSRFTDPDNQANLYCGFYPSKNGDRKYGASDFGRFLNGLICDGVFLTVYNQFKVSPASPDNPGRSIIVDTGKAWFNGTWLELVDEYSIECAESYRDGDRYDAIVIAINTTDSDVTYDEQVLPANDTTIIAIKGIKSTAGNPVVPITAGNQEVTEGVYLYPLADIYRGRDTAAITTSDIRIRVGESVCPYAEALVTPSNDATEFTEMWRAQLDAFIDSLHTDWEAEKEKYNEDWNLYFDAKKTETDNWLANEEATINAWFERIKGTLGEDVAVGMYEAFSRHEIDNWMTNGFPFGTTTISDDGKTIETIQQDTGNKLTKTFNDDFSMCSIQLSDNLGNHLGLRMIYFDDENTIRTQSTMDDTTQDEIVDLKPGVPPTGDVEIGGGW